MALRVLILKKKIDEKSKELESLRAKASELETREAELEQDIEAAETDEEKAAVEEAVEAFEKEKAENAEAKDALEKEIGELETELSGQEERQKSKGVVPEQKKEEIKMSERTKFFGMSIEERDRFIAREDVQALLTEVRTAIKEKRALTNVGYLVPKVMLGLLRENIERYSKLYRHCNVQRVNGQSRMVIQGQIPEAVWTEMCANLNELDLSFSQVEVDGYKVGGYFRVCNAMLEDSDIDLAATLLDVLGQAIGYALDKAILYGTGTKMPTGVVKSLSLVTNTPNIVSHAASVTGIDLWQAIVLDSGKAKSDYARGEKVWVMNETTYTTLVAEALSINAAGAIVSGINGTMPVIGGVIEVLNFLPDNTIIGGYFDLYLLAERAGVELNTSEHAFWVADQTGFKGTARYDGKVLDVNAFIAIGINGVTPAANAVTFAADTAN